MSLDLSTVGASVYFIIFIALIFVTMFIFRTKVMTVESFFFANHNTHWLVLSISFLVVCLLGFYFLRLTFSSSAWTIAVLLGMLSVIMLFIMGRFLVPKYIAENINTIPGYFEKRFDKKCKYYLSVLYISYDILIRLTLILVVSCIFINKILGVDAFTILVFFIVITGTYVIIGGLQAEIYVSVIQMFFIVLGIIGFYFWLFYQNDKTPSLFGEVSSVKVDSEYSWTGLIFGLPILGFWFWCSDQFIIQKAITARSVSFVKKATLMSGILQIIPVMAFILLGISTISLPLNISPDGTSNALFQTNIIPGNIRWGLIVAAAAVLMASFASFLNTTSLLITFDFYRSFKPEASDRKLVLIGRLTIMALLIYSILLIPVCQTMDFGVCLKLFKTYAYFASLVAAVFLIGLLNQKIDSKSILSTLFIATGIILTRSILDFFSTGQNVDNVIFNWFARSGFLDFTVFVFIVSIILPLVFHRFRINSKSTALLFQRNMSGK